MLWWHWRCCLMYRVFSTWLPRVCSLAHTFFFAWCCLFQYASEIRGVRFTVLNRLDRFRIFFRVNPLLTTLFLQINVNRFQYVEFTKNARRFWLAWQYLRNICQCWLIFLTDTLLFYEWKHYYFFKILFNKEVIFLTYLHVVIDQMQLACSYEIPTVQGM